MRKKKHVSWRKLGCSSAAVLYESDIIQLQNNMQVYETRPCIIVYLPVRWCQRKGYPGGSTAILEGVSTLGDSEPFKIRDIPQFSLPKYGIKIYIVSEHVPSHPKRW